MDFSIFSNYYFFIGKTISMKFFNGLFEKGCDWQGFQAVIFDWSQPIPSKIPLSELYGTNQIFSITSFGNNKKSWIFENDIKKLMEIKFVFYKKSNADSYFFFANICIE